MVEPRWCLHITCTSSSSQTKHEHDNMTLKNMRLTKAHLDKALAAGVTIKGAVFYNRFATTKGLW